MSAFTVRFVPTLGAERISKLPPLIQSNVLRALHDGILIAERISKTEYLTAGSTMGPPRPDRLVVRSGLLRSRVLGVLSGTRGDPKIFGSATLGVSGVVYGPIHEFGGTINHPGSQARKGKFMVFFWKGRWRKFMRTKPHPIKIPARPYLKPAFDDALPEMKRLVQDAIDRAYKDS